MARTLVVGDVHGCREELEQLLVKAGLGPEDRLVFVGDLVAKGPDSQGVVQLARERGALAVLGNHDAHVLGARHGRRLRASHEAVARSLGSADWAYLEGLPLYLELPERVRPHGEGEPRAAEPSRPTPFTPSGVEGRVSRTDQNLGGAVLVVHGGLVPGVDLEHQERHLLLNLRSFDAAGAPSTRADGGTPWASHWPGPQLVLFGHDALRGLQRHPHALGLDTGCVYGKLLTAVWLPSGELVQVAARRVWQTPDPG